MTRYFVSTAIAFAWALGEVRAGPAPTVADGFPVRSAAPAMPLGDSITWGVGGSTGNGYRPHWATRLTSDGHSLDFVDSGRNGTMADPDNEGHSRRRIDRHRRGTANGTKIQLHDRNSTNAQKWTALTPV